MYLECSISTRRIITVTRSLLSQLGCFLRSDVGRALFSGLFCFFFFFQQKTAIEIQVGFGGPEIVKRDRDNSTFFKAVMTIIIADVSMSLDNVLGVAGAAKQHYVLLVFGLILSILLMATVANIISKWIKKYKWIGWLGLLAILAVAIELIYSDINVFL